jgi:hypothetical protein
MANGQMISCNQYANYLISQEPVYDKMIVQDTRPIDGLMGYYKSEGFDSYSGTTHTFDRATMVFPDITVPWTPFGTDNCSGTPCDPERNPIGWGNKRATYSLVEQNWKTDLLCFDQMMTKTRAKEHMAQVVNKVLKDATSHIMNGFLYRVAIENAEKKLCVSTGLPEITFAWDTGGYRYLTVRRADNNALITPGGRMTAEILRTQVQDQYLRGAIPKEKDGFGALQFHTDIDTFQYLGKEAPTLYDKWRFGTFGPAAKEYYKYGFSGYIGDFMVKCLMMPWRFNQVSTGRFQHVLPFVNEASAEGLRSMPNPDYQRARYQFSMINNPTALTIMPFRAEALNPNMPFLVRDYGGSWKFRTNDLGADCNGKPIDNSEGNKGRFQASFRLAVKPTQPDRIVAFFHQVSPACPTIIEVCSDDPGYPAQDYNSANELCDQVILIVATPDSEGAYTAAAGSITCGGNIVPGAEISEADLGDFVTELQTQWEAAGLAGDWTVVDEDAGTIMLDGGTCSDVSIAFDL